MEFRAINWSRDGAAIRSLDTSFTTDRVYSLRQADLSFSLVEEMRTPAVTKRYEVAITEESIAASLATIAAHEGDVLHGFASVKKEPWNRRAIITDFYLDPRSRRLGFGRNMMKETFARVVEASVRVLWVETQNVNLPAVNFYRSMGFDICGFDSRLYDEPLDAEVALYLSKSLPNPEPFLALEPTISAHL